MKITKSILILILLITVLPISNSVLATEGEELIPKVDFSNATFKLIKTNSSTVQFYSLEVSGVTLPNKSNEKPVEMNIRYTIGNNEPEFSSKYGESYSGTYDAETQKIVFPRAETVLQLNGDIYFWIFQLDDTSVGQAKTGSLVYSNKLERPTEKKYVDLFGSPLIGSTLTYISIDTPMENYLKRKAQFRIGEITDNSILTAIKNNDTKNGFDKLLSYGKDSLAIYDGVLEGSPNFAANLHDNLLGKVTDDTYYFIYVKFDDEDGKYYPVEGVTVGLGLAPTTQSCEIAFYGNTKFNWDGLEDIQVPTNIDEDDNNKDIENAHQSNDSNKDEKQDPTVAKTSLPDTGNRYIVLGALLGLSIILIVFCYLNKRYNFIK